MDMDDFNDSIVGESPSFNKTTSTEIEKEFKDKMSVEQEDLAACELINDT